MAITKKMVHDSLIKQLEAKGARTAHFEALVEDYMQLFCLQKDLKKDIQKRGVSYLEPNSKGDKVTKNNPSVKDLVSVGRQMLTILEKLGLTTDAPTGEESDQDDFL